MKKDADAAMEVARYYDRRNSEPQAAIEWYERAAEFGNVKALRKLFDAYYFGFAAPKNSVRAEEYLRRAAEANAAWAQLIVAKRVEKSEPASAFQIYLNQAQAGNCYAQARLSRAYVGGDLGKRSLTHSYFWQLLASVDRFGREYETHYLLEDGRSGFGDKRDCLLAERSSASKLEAALPQNLTRLVQEAATNWRRGQKEPLLPTFAGPDELPSEAKTPPPVVPAPRPTPPVASRSTNLPAPLPRQPTWTPLSSAMLLPAVSLSRDATALFETVSRSVWLVVAAHSAGDLSRSTDVALGSAVAVGPQTLLTNCHVVEGRPFVWIKQGETVIASAVSNGHSESDRCVLSVKKPTLHPAIGMRRYSEIRVGEPVYTIGSPRGLERSLGQGIISGLRRVDGRPLIQTTAQISAGSSGGGLFDQHGNLVGITTFRLKDSEALNFAIAVDDYFRP